MTDKTGLDPTRVKARFACSVLCAARRAHDLLAL